ncbi:MAG: ribonuclease HII [Nanoarchaeota archaeon]|nr:ribonuclease HII [Nanoarchaeota archaeon]
MVLLAGIDEAGRGPIIGPMVIAICMIDEDSEFELKSLGVKDSKLLSERQREKLFLVIKSMCKNKIVVVHPKEIDAAVESKTSNLNWLEADHSAKLIKAIRPDKVVLDCPSNNIQAFTDYVRSKLPTNMKDVKVISEHKADFNHPIVAAASILAKVTREREIQKIKEMYKVHFGSGYPSDPETKEFVQDNWHVYPIFRKSWETYKRVAKAKEQKNLGEF